MPDITHPKMARKHLKTARAERVCVPGVITVLRGIQLLVTTREKPWKGTITRLVRTLKSHGVAVDFAPNRLAIWLRQHEPTLWWDYGISVHFRRTGRRRFIELSTRSE